MSLPLRVAFVLSLFALALVPACGGGVGVGVGFYTYGGTQSPGDVWTYTLGGGTFTARNETLGHDYSGSTTALANGYLRLDVTGSTDPGIGTLPVVAYALEFPGIALLVLPPGDDPQVIACAALGDIPTAESTYNYVKLPDPDWGTGSGGVDTEEAWGVGDSMISGASNEVFNFYSYLWDMGNDTATPTEEGLAPETFTATGGWLVPDVGDQRIAVTSAGVFIQDSGPHSGGSFGVEAPATDLGLGTLFAEDHDFLGFTFHYDDPSDDTQPVWARVRAGEAYITGGEFTSTTGSFDDAVPGAADARLTFTSEPRPGVFRGTLTEPGPDGTLGTADDVDGGDFVMLCSNIEGRYFVFGIIEPHPSTTKPVNFLVFEQ